MHKNIWIDLGLLNPIFVQAEWTISSRLGIISKKTLKAPILFYAVMFFLVILATTEVTYAEKKITIAAIDNVSLSAAATVESSKTKHKSSLKQVVLGTYQSRAQVEKIALKLRQLGFDTWVKHLNNGYVVNAGAFSSKSNLKRAVSKLKKAGLSDKVRVIEVGVEKKNSKAVASVKPKKIRSTVINAKTTSLQNNILEEDYVPKKEYVKLEQEVEILKAQMELLLNNQVESGQALKPKTTAKPTTEKQPNTNNLKVVAEGSREKEAEDSKRELDTFLRSQKVLYKRGELALDYNLSYGQGTEVNTFGFPPPTNSFNTTAKLTTRSVDTSLTMRYGIDDNLEFDLTVPYGYFEQNSDNQPFNINTQPVSHTNASGIGDISGALRYTALTEVGNIPDVTVSLSTQAPTGNRHKGLGSGFWSVGAGVSLVKTIDPVVFFGSIGYTAVLEDRGIDPGNQVSYSLGFGYSMNDRVSFTTSLSGGITNRTEQNGFERPGSSLDSHSLQFSSTIQLSKRLFLEPFVGFGLTDDASDFLVGFRVPYRFEQKYPLPFFSD